MIPRRRKWQSTPVLLPGKSHGQSNLVGYSPWGRKELDTTEWLHFLGNCKLKQGDAITHLLWVSEWVSEWASKVTQSCLTLCDPMGSSLPGSLVHGILQARILKWVAISFSKGSSQPRDQTQVSCIVDRRFTVWATGEVQATEGTLYKFDTKFVKGLLWKKRTVIQKTNEQKVCHSIIDKILILQNL